MRNDNKHILFLATEFDAPGMRPYARAIINAMWKTGDHVLIVTRYGTDLEGLDKVAPESITWIDYPTSKPRRAVFRYWPTQVNKVIDHFVTTQGISIVYSLTGELILARCIQRLQRTVPVLYTVHDAVFHDYKFSTLTRWLKDKFIIEWPQRYLFKHARHMVTNSHEQLQYIGQHYPGHETYYAPFPTLVNNTIATGGQEVPELQAIDTSNGYILFFGTIHLYKGVHLLYETYRTRRELQEVPLVIAGTGNIYFERGNDEKNVVFINRFIDDSELRDLFSRAATVVYPYISATQSGVTSIAAFFDKPMVLSDLPFFKQVCEDHNGVKFFTTGNDEALADAILRSLHSPTSTREIYEQNYSPQAMKSALDSIVNSILSPNEPMRK